MTEARLVCSVFGDREEDCKVWRREHRCAGDCPYYRSNWKKASLPHYPKGRKYARMRHRLLTGLQIAQNGKQFMRFLTLTTGIERVKGRTGKIRSIKDSFDILRDRIRRATLKKDGFLGFKFNRYYCLRTLEGNGVLHVIYWGRFIPQDWLSLVWEKIHGAFRVDIRACWTKKRKVDGLVGYLLSNYLEDQPVERMSYGWKWAWLGFCKSWEHVKAEYGLLGRGVGELRSVVNACLRCWLIGRCRGNIVSAHDMFRSRIWGAWSSLLWCHPETSRQTKIVRYFGGG